jgi:hypothetical protein
MKDRKLKVVPKADEQPLVDIYAADRAKIAARDWAKLHVAGDRSAALDIYQPPHKRTWANWGTR